MKFKFAGFTIIELIIVIAVISLLAAVIFVAVDPTQRFGEAQNATRDQHARELEKALGLLVADNGALPAALESLGSNTPYMLVSGGVSTAGTVNCPTLDQDIARIDIASLLAPYVGTLPVDPLATGGDTGHYLTKVNDGSFYIDHCYVYSANDGGEEGGGWTCGDTLTDDRDSKTYATVLIGTQCWMAQNINVGTLISSCDPMGTDCPSAAAIEKCCYDNLEANCTSDGAIYKWSQAMCNAASCNGTDESSPACATPVQGICPVGWHIPSHYEFVLLERTLCTSGSCSSDFPYDNTTVGERGTNEGTKLKVGGTSGFEFKLNGYWDNYEGMFLGRNTSGSIWSSSIRTAGYAYTRQVSSGLNTVARYGIRYSGGDFYADAIRCVKD